jgi:hypothetical protein
MCGQAEKPIREVALSEHAQEALRNFGWGDIIDVEQENGRFALGVQELVEKGLAKYGCGKRFAIMTGAGMHYNVKSALLDAGRWVENEAVEAQGNIHAG